MPSLTKTLACLPLALAATACLNAAALADYIPPGGDPPTGRTSTSG